MPFPQVMGNGNIYFVPETSYSPIWHVDDFFLALKVQISDLSENNYSNLDTDIFGFK